MSNQPSRESASPQQTSVLPPDERPFCAPCRTLSLRAPWRWLQLGWQDFRHAIGPSFCCGLVIVGCGYSVILMAFKYVNLSFLLPLLSGFVFLGPILAMAFYEISAQLQKDQQPTLTGAIRVSLSHLSDQMVFALILVIIFLVWARAASLLHVFFPIHSAQPADLLLFFSIGTTVGALFSAFVFCINAFSLPMLMAKQTDSVTAVVTSFNAVLRNKGVMIVWSMLIVTAVVVGLLTGLLGLAVTLPWVGHATWHAFQETIDASAWPDHEI